MTKIITNQQGKVLVANGNKVFSMNGGSGLTESDVNFWDYDGTLVAAYTAADFLALSALPANPSHAGLTAQGWNWTLADAKAAVAQTGCLDIGAMYNAPNGYSLVCDIPSTLLSIGLYMGGNGNIYIDWGDGTNSTASVEDEGLATHTYSTAGRYIINAYENDGNSELYEISVSSASAAYGAYVYMVKEIWASAGRGIYIDTTKFPSIEALLLSTGNGWYYESYTNDGALTVTTLVFPTGTPIVVSTLTGAPNIKALPIGNGFNANISITGTKIARLVLPSTIGRIGRLILIADLYILATTPPTLTSTLDGIKSIHIPNGTLSAYQSATNWSNYASIMVEMPA